MDKSAQDLMERVRRLGTSAQDYMGRGTEAMSNWYEGVSPDAKKLLMRGLLGAGIGGGTAAALKALTPKDPEEGRGRVLGPALLGALLGGGAAAGLPAGLKMIGGGLRFEGAKKRPAAAKAIDKLVDPMVRNPATTIGGAAGVAKAPALSRLIKSYTGRKVRPGKAALVSVPAGLLLGSVIDRYLKGRF
jgi:hypothetical protein